MEKKITDIFGTLVFDEDVMEERLAKDTFRELQKTIKEGKSLNIKIANAVANAMKDWAVEHGATHYTHSVSYTHLGYIIQNHIWCYL